MDFLDWQVDDSDRIMHQDNKIEILGIVFQMFRDVPMIAISMWYDTVCMCVPSCVESHVRCTYQV